MTEFLNDIDAMRFLVLPMVAIVAFMLGMLHGEFKSLRQASQKAIVEMKDYLSMSALVSKYAPRPNLGAKRWQNPIDGEFVDDKDITKELAEYHGRPIDTAQW